MSIYNGLTGIWKQGRGISKTSDLPVNSPTDRSGQTQPSQPSGQHTGMLFLLMCVKYGCWALRLKQENACSIQSDQQLFHILRVAHQEGRPKLKSLLSFETLVSIKFVKFEVFKNYLTTIVKVPDLPPPSHKAEYCPCSNSTEPPIGENLLMHYYHHPHDADDALVWFDRIPKKLHRRVHLDDNRRTDVGWGVHLIEGLDWSKLWALGLIGLLLSLLFGVLWSVFAGSIQNGFAVAGCIMTVLTCALGMAQAGFGST
ncbi:hypothetical protein MMC08_003775 [Hypocenomyce scalaris]|nr:hypothetical protein [Hypocenomyce scalaris]